MLPVLLLAVAVVISAVIGLSLSDGATRSIAEELGCEHVSSSHPQAGVDKQTCSYNGDMIVILTLSKGEHTIPPPDMPDNILLGTSGSVWVVGCQRHDDCVKIQRTLGGHLSSGPLLGLSLVVG